MKRDSSPLPLAPALPSSPDVDAGGSTPHGLAFLALLSFVGAFLGARIFATLNPTTIVETGGIHLHHFWYGLAMIVVAGWLGIVHNRPALRRFYAILFGLGGGILGDEVGLLLTLGNYHSDLTFFFFITVVTAGTLGILLTTRRKTLEYDVLTLGYSERFVYLGVVVAGLSALPFASGLVLPGLVTLAAGIVIAAVAFWRHEKKEAVKE
ncbi:MAG: hypothetical protein OK474_04900 [Thaumarchaeota archaeon]|nr:hypothetical protein [Nitrososphaerota archaeon]